MLIAKKGSKKESKSKEVDKTGDHPLPKRPPSSWSYFNQEFNKKWVAEGKKPTEAFKGASIEWKPMTEE